MRRVARGAGDPDGSLREPQDEVLELLHQSLRRNRAITLFDPRLDQIERLLIGEIRRDPTALAEAVAGRLSERKVRGHVTRLRQLHRNREASVLVGAHEEEGLLLHLHRTMAPRKLLI